MSEYRNQNRHRRGARHVGETVEIAGWLYNLRKSGKIMFPAAARRQRHFAVRRREERAARGSLRSAEEPDAGIVADRHRQTARRAARAGRLRMDVESAECAARAESDPYPITPKEHGIDFLMDHRHLWLRSRRQHAILRVRHAMIKAIRDYFDSTTASRWSIRRSSRPPRARAPPRCSR
jgi:asparaginyl-tRNA synthetase